MFPVQNNRMNDSRSKRLLARPSSCCYTEELLELVLPLTPRQKVVVRERLSPHTAALSVPKCARLQDRLSDRQPEPSSLGWWAVRELETKPLTPP